MSVIAALKKDCNKVEMRIVIRNGNPVTDEDLRPWQRGWRRYKRYNTVGIFFDTNGIAINYNQYESQLDIPRASLVEYNGKELRIYNYGQRRMNPYELEAWSVWKRITETETYKQQLEYDCLTDCSTTYYRKLAFFKERNLNYMRGFDWERGCKLNWNKMDYLGNPMIFDQRIKGDLLMKYEVREVA